MVSILERSGGAVGNSTHRDADLGGRAGDHEEQRRPLRVLIVAPHPLLRLGICVTLRADTALRVVGDVATMPEAEPAASVLAPDILLLSREAAGPLRCEVVPFVERLKQIAPGTRVVLLSSTLDENDARQALRAGVGGYLPATIAPQALVAGLKTVADGEIALPKALVRQLTQRLAAAS